MRVGLDYLPAVSHAPGVGRYARELARALVRLPDGPELRLFEVGTARRTIGEPALGLVGSRARRVRARVPRRVLALAHAVSGFGADTWLGGVDLFHQVRFDPPPLARARQTLAVSELPEPGSDAEASARALLGRVDGALVFSACAGRELERRFAFPEERIHAVPVGCDHWRRGLSGRPERERPPRVLVLGALRPERRHAAVVAAIGILSRGGLDARLLAVGRSGPARGAFEAAVRDHRAADRVEWRESLGEEDLALAVARAAVLVQLGERDLTAVTPLEALALGTPVVASRIPAFEEALAGEAILVDTAEVDRDPRVLADALARAIASAGDGARREAFAAASSWEANARATLAAWRSVLEREPRPR